MIGFRSLLMAGCSVVLCGTGAWAADFYVKPSTPGPVAGTPLGAVNLQSSSASSSSSASPEGSSSLYLRLRTPVPESGAWVQPTTTTAPVAKAAAAAPAPAAAAPAPAVTQVQPTAAGTGTAWNSVGELLKSGQVKGGDRILLMGGYYGALNIMNAKFTSPVTIQAVPGQVAHAETMTVRASSNLIIRDLKLWALTENHPVPIVVRTYGDTSNITLNNLDVRAYKDSVGYMNWSQAKWLANQRSAFLLDGDKVTIKNSRVTGVYHGIQSTGPNGTIENNIVDGFAGDGMRALGDNALVKGNKLQNCFQINANHADGFQSFSRDPVTGKAGTGVVSGLKLIGNKIVEWNSSATNPLRCKLQGIGMFDGMYDDLVIQNNLIVSSHYHGITVTGTRRAVISNNTVVNMTGGVSKYPWIKVANHKNGTLSANVAISNNMANQVAPLPSGIVGGVTSNNLVPVWSRDFVAPRTLNFALTTGSPAGDAGLAKYAPKDDILLVPRPKGKGPDIGAYESR